MQRAFDSAVRARLIEPEIRIQVPDLSEQGARDRLEMRVAERHVIEVELERDRIVEPHVLGIHHIAMDHAERKRDDLVGPAP